MSHVMIAMLPLLRGLFSLVLTPLAAGQRGGYCVTARGVEALRRCRLPGARRRRAANCPHWPVWCLLLGISASDDEDVEAVRLTAGLELPAAAGQALRRGHLAQAERVDIVVEVLVDLGMV